MSRLQVTLFAPPRRISHWHSSGNLDYNIDRVRWNAVPGYAALHRTVQWWENWVNDTRLNLEGNEVAVADDRIDGRAEGDCHDVSLGLSFLDISSEAFNTMAAFSWIPSIFTPPYHQQRHESHQSLSILAACVAALNFIDTCKLKERSPLSSALQQSLPPCNNLEVIFSEALQCLKVAINALNTLLTLESS